MRLERQIHNLIVTEILNEWLYVNIKILCNVFYFFQCLDGGAEYLSM